MAITVTAGFNNIWNHLERFPEEDDSFVDQLTITSVTPIDGGVDVVMTYQDVEFRLINKGPTAFYEYESWVGQSLGQVFEQFQNALITEQSIYIAGSFNSKKSSDSPVLGRDWDPDGSDVNANFAFYAGDDTFYGAATEIPDPTDDDEVDVSDEINGYAGNDAFWGRLGDDRFVGGDGMDTAYYDGNLSQFTLTQVEGVWNESVGEGFPGWQISDTTGAEGTDHMTGVERAVFADATVALDLDGVGGEAYRIYKAAFDRVPDAGGLGYWIKQMDDGMDLIEVSARFIDSDEFRSLYGQNPTNGEFLTKVYNNVLDRDPDQGGYAWWIDQLENNPDKTWEKVLADFSESPENLTNVAELIANGIQYEPWLVWVSPMIDLYWS